MASTRHAQRLKLKREIQRRLEPLRHGDPLPPLRELMVAAGVGQRRLDAVLEELQSEGLIERRPRLGVYKSCPDGQDNLEPACIDAVFCYTVPTQCRAQFDPKTMYTGLMVDALTAAAGQRHRAVRVHHMTEQSTLDDYRALAARPDVKAVVLVSMYDQALGDIFTNHSVPWVSLISRIGPHPGAPCIAACPDEITQLQLEHLWSLGHERIGMLWSGPNQMPNYMADRRRDSFFEMMLQRGLRVAPNWVVPADYDEHNVIAALDTIFAFEPHPTAAIMADPHLPVAYRYLNDRGLCVGRDFSVVGTDDVAIAAMVSPPATTVRNSPYDAGRLAVRALEQVYAGREAAPVQNCPAELIVRESTGPAPTNHRQVAEEGERQRGRRLMASQ